MPAGHEEAQPTLSGAPYAYVRLRSFGQPVGRVSATAAGGLEDAEEQARLDVAGCGPGRRWRRVAQGGRDGQYCPNRGGSGPTASPAPHVLAANARIARNDGRSARAIARPASHKREVAGSKPPAPIVFRTDGGASVPRSGACLLAPRAGRGGSGAAGRGLAPGTVMPSRKRQRARCSGRAALA